MGKIYDAHDSKDQRHAHADQGVEGSGEQPVHACLKKRGQLSLREGHCQRGDLRRSAKYIILDIAPLRERPTTVSRYCCWRAKPALPSTRSRSERCFSLAFSLPVAFFRRFAVRSMHSTRWRPASSSIRSLNPRGPNWVWPWKARCRISSFETVLVITPASVNKNLPPGSKTLATSRNAWARSWRCTTTSKDMT